MASNTREFKYFSLADPEAQQFGSMRAPSYSPLDSNDDNEFINPIPRRRHRHFFRKKWLFACVIIITLVILIIASIVVFTRLFERFSQLYPKPITGYNGAVSTEHPSCSLIGLNILKNGGNALDSAIASGICIGTLNCFSSGIGGGGFMLVRLASGDFKSFDFREYAPSRATESMFVNDTSKSELGGLSIAVPGEVAGYYEAHRNYGKMEWHKLFEPSIALARNGFPVSSVMESRIYEARELIPYLVGFNETFMRDGRLLAVGDIIYRKNYANTLEKIAKYGKDAFYSGDIAQDSVSTIQKAGGIMTIDDLSNYTVETPIPLVGFYHGKKIVSTDAPSSGAILLSILNILEKYHFEAEGKTYSNVHRILESFKFAYAQRTELGDPKFVEGLRDRLNVIISKEEAYRLRQNLTDSKTHDWKYYNPQFETKDNHGTTHLSVLDKDQMAVAITSTINLSFGSKVMSTQTGIIFNDHMDDFSTPGKTNAFGLPPSKSNFIRPFKRPMSSTVPTIVESDGKVELVIGASGGSRITTAVAQVMVNVLDFGMTMQKAISAPRLHHQLLPDQVYMEHEYNVFIEKDLESRGHKVVRLDKRESLADVQAIYRHRSGKMEPGADIRKGGSAMAY